jgi:glycosyltransferase involved in cell wall biosynthesis
MFRGKRISVVIPCRNEEAGVRVTLEQMPAIVDEVLVVDNASTDRTAEVARSLGARVVHEARKGYGRAYRTGFEHARGDIIVTMDGDGTYPPNSIPLLLYVLLEERIDFMTARRWRSKNDKSKSPLRLLGNAILSSATMVLFGRFLIDSQSGMWIFRRDILDRIRPESDGMALSQELKILAFTHPEIRCLEMPIYYGDRVGESKLNLWKDGFGNLIALGKLRLTLGRRRRRAAAATVTPLAAGDERPVAERRASQVP